VAASLQNLYGIAKCRVITNGIPTDAYAHPQTPRNEWRARENFGDDDVLFVCVAGFRPQKNHALLLKAFAQGPASDPKAHLVLVGEGVLREQIERLAKQHDLTRQVHFLGLRTDIPDVLGAMDVFVLSSDWEGNPLSVMEAMASGLPIVSTAVGGVPDLFENGKEGVLVPAGDVQALSSSLTNLLRDREARKSLGLAAGRKAKGKYDVSAMIQAYEEMYEQILEQRHALKAEGPLHESAVGVQEGAGSQSR
jgi:glycosyltransferase involved in cell wall biosynthesis